MKIREKVIKAVSNHDAYRELVDIANSGDEKDRCMAWITGGQVPGDYDVVLNFLFESNDHNTIIKDRFVFVNGVDESQAVGFAMQFNLQVRMSLPSIFQA